MKIAVVGSYGVGLTMRVPRMPAPGETLSDGAFDEGHGGKGSNQAIGAARLGATVSFLTAIGDDGYGAAAKELWEREHIDTTRVVIVDDAATMVGFILVEPNGENRIVIAPGALNSLDAEAVESFREDIRSADVLVVSMEIPLDAVVAALRVGREEGALTLLNPAPAQRLPDEAWQYIDIVTPNQSEAPVLLGLDADHGLNEREIVERLAQSATHVVLTRGEVGALLASEGAVSTIDAVAVEHVVDTTGAGDSFTAALAVGLASGATLADAARGAAHAAAHTVTIAGVIPALPTQADLSSPIGANR